MVKRVGCVGLGLMGSALSANLIKGGFEVVGYDIVPERVREHEGRGGRGAKSVGEVARGAEVVLTSLPHGGVVRQLAEDPDGLLAAAPRGLVWADTSTVAPEESEAVAALCAERGVEFLDSTVSGTSVMAWERDLLVMVGGERSAFERARPVLEAIGREVRHLGPVGSGARAKLVVNLVLGLNRVALAEGLTLAEKAGIDLATMVDVLNASAAYSRAIDMKGEKMVRGEWSPTGRLRTGVKDVSLMLELGKNVGAPLPFTALSHQLRLAALAKGYGDLDGGVIHEVLREMAGLAPRGIPPGAGSGKA